MSLLGCWPSAAPRNSARRFHFWIRTSGSPKMMPTVFWIGGSWTGRLGILLRPRGGDWLDDEIRSWGQAGLQHIISALTADELTELELDDEEKHCHEQGLRFRSFAIPDRGLPSSYQATAELVTEIEQSLAAGESVGVHCRQGIGRSALVVAAVLVAAGQKPKAAFRTIEKARGCTVPDTVEQRDWLDEFARRLPSAGVEP